LPEGNGKELVQTTCTRCHALNMVTNSWGNTREGWETLFSSMVAVAPGFSSIVCAAAEAPAEQLELVTVGQ